ncbi:MAG: exodeoxyribonuclease VII large subunit, partial [Chloroflexi bacterium]|nr:exodeoxyribonuclease VII large subunit [Chloroflexota bacterium]
MAEQFELPWSLEPAVLTVSQLTRHIRDLIENDEYLQDLWVQGEISNLTRPPSGHIYFTVKDAEASLKCLIWRSIAQALEYLPQDGQAVILHGHISLYEPRGDYQFYVDLVQPAGVGTLFLRFQELKERLAAEGLFALERKRPIPPFPKTIGVVTSPQAAALRDILRILGERYPLVEVILAPAQVQGASAAIDIATAIRLLNDSTDAEVMIVARGGGSLEELWAFNEEIVARAIYESRIPIITGIGHETDFTIADFVADLRAPTPTAAAALAVPDQRELREEIARAAQELAENMQTALAMDIAQVGDAQFRLLRISPQNEILRLRQRLDELAEETRHHWSQQTRLLRRELETKGLLLASLDPEATLERGYSITTDFESGGIIKKVAQVAKGQKVAVQVSDGRFVGKVEELSAGQ